MNKIVHTALVLGMVSFPALAKHDDYKLYAAAKFSFAHQDITSLSVIINDTTNIPIHDKADNVVGGALAIGYAFESFRIEIEGELHQQFKVDNANIQSNTIMANIYYDFENSSMFTPYITAGAGAVETRFKVINFDHTDKNIEFAYNTGLGVAADITESIAIDLMYRYTSFGNAEFDHTTDGTNLKVKGNNFSSELLLGVRYTF